MGGASHHAAKILGGREAAAAHAQALAEGGVGEVGAAGQDEALQVLPEDLAHLRACVRVHSCVCACACVRACE